MRLSAPALRGQRKACEHVARELARGFDLDRVVVRPVTGSVIVQDASSALDPGALVARLEDLLARGLEEDGAALTDEPRDGQSSTRLARALSTAARGINDDVRKALHGKADLASLAPLLLFAASAAEVSIAGKLVRVPWYNLLWYGLRSFLAFNPAAIDDDPPSGS